MKSPHLSSPLFIVSLLSVSLLLSDAGAVSPVLPSLAEQFPDIPGAAIQSFITAPSLAAVVATLVVGGLASRIGKRRLALGGMIAILLGGLAPLVLIPLGNYWIVLVARLLVGLGIGTLQPVSASLIVDFYQGRARNRLLGWQSSVVGAGNVVWGVIVAWLMGWGWMAAFWVYLAVLVIFALFALFVPEPPNNVAEDSTDIAAAVSGSAPKVRLPRGAIVAAVLMMLMTMAFQANAISLPFLAVTEREIVSGASVSLLMSVFGIASIVAGVCFGWVYRGLQKWTGTVALVVLGAGLTTAISAHSSVALFVTVVLIGLGFGTYMPFSFTSINRHTDAGNSALAVAVLFTGAAIGGFLAPYVFDLGGRIIGNTAGSGQFVVALVVLIVTLVWATAFYLRDYSRTPSEQLSAERV